MKNNKEWKEAFLSRLMIFSVSIIKLTNSLPRTPTGFAIAGQIVRSGTSIGANVEEAQDASSRKDFIQKLSIALREAKETKYWLKLVKAANLLDTKDVQDATKECEELIAILISSVRSSKQKEI